VIVEDFKSLSISKLTLKRLCKKAKLSWKRVRKSLRSKRDDEEFSKAVEGIKILLEKADKGELNFYCFGEPDFTLEPCAPYAWQRAGKYWTKLSD